MSELWPRWKGNEQQRLVLSCIIADPSLLDEPCMKNITEKHFTDLVMKEYFILESTGERVPLEVLVEVHEDSALPRFFNRYVHHLVKEWRSHCEDKVKEKAQLLLDDGKTGEAHRLLDKLSSIGMEDEWVDFTEGYKESFKQKQKEIAEGVTGGMRTGFHGLDQLTGGMHKGQLWVVGAGVGHGKTTLATQVAKNVAKRGGKVGVFSLEMSRQSVLERFACSMADIDYTNYINAKITDRELVSITNEIQGLARLGIMFYDNPAADTETLLAAAYDRGFDLIIIDHLQRVKHTGNSSLNERAFAVAHTGKTMARQNDCTVMLISQFSREHSKRTEGDGKRGRPSMTDFRDSGMIEAEADTILLLYRPSEYGNKCDPSEAEWIIPKLRFGQTGFFRMRWAGRKGWQDLEVKHLGEV